MEKQFHMIAMDAEGNVIREETTKQSYCVSELQMFMDKVKMDLYSGKVQHVAISADDKGKIR